METSAPKNLIIKVPTKRLYEKVVKKAIEEGCRWRNGNKKDINQDYWSYGGKNTAIYINIKRIKREEKVLTYGSFERKRDDSYIILTAQEYLQRK